MGRKVNSRPMSAEQRAAARRVAIANARNKRIMLLVLSLCLVLILVASIFVGLRFLKGPEDDGRILDNVVVGGISLGGMTKEDAANAIRLSIEPVLNNQSLIVRLDNEELELSPQRTNIQLDVEELVEAAYSYGRTGSRYERNLARSRDKIYTIALLPYLRLDLAYIRSAVENFCANYNVSMVEPTVSIDGSRPTYNPKQDPDSVAHQTITITMGTPESILDATDLYYEILDAYSLLEMEFRYETPIAVAPEKPNAQDIFDLYCIYPADAILDPKTYAVVPEVYGYGFNVTMWQRRIEQADYGQTLQITLEFLMPDITEKDLTGGLFKDTLAKHTASCTESDAHRNKNLEQACKTLNGLVIKPGESFDLNAVLGPRTVERGYFSAPVYVGSTTNIVGGGVDQVASALYYCALKSGLQIDEHHYHRYAMTYTPMGTDAAMGSGENFVFTNTTSAPIRILAEVTGSSVKITLKGTRDQDYLLDIESVVVAENPPTILYQTVQKDNVYGYLDGDIIQTGLTGYQVATYLCKYDRVTGMLISRELLAELNYEKRDIIIIKIETTE